MRARKRFAAHGTGVALRLWPHRAVGHGHRRRRARGCRPESRHPARFSSRAWREPEDRGGVSPCARANAPGSRSPTAHPTSPIPSTSTAQRALDDLPAHLAQLEPAPQVQGQTIAMQSSVRSSPSRPSLSGPRAASWPSPTTSLARIGLAALRNWDYRYCWLRDTTFTLLALMNAGYFEEAEAWQDWLLRALAGSPDQVQIMYGLNGEQQLVEWKVDWLDGLREFAPGSRRQCGVAAGAARYLRRDARFVLPRPARHATAQRGRLSRSCAAAGASWRPSGKNPITESGRRAAKPQHFTYSKMMAWVAFDRARAAGRATEVRRSR